MTTASENWIDYLRQEFENLHLLEKDELHIYLVLLQSNKPLIGSELATQIPNLKRTHIYGLLDRMQETGWVSINNPSQRPAKYQAVNPTSILEKKLISLKEQIPALERLRTYLQEVVEPQLSHQIYPGRVSNTFLIPQVIDLFSQIEDKLTRAHERILCMISQETLDKVRDQIIQAESRIMETRIHEHVDLRFEYLRDYFAKVIYNEDPETCKDDPLNKISRAWACTKGSIQTEIFIIDNTVFLNNLNGGFGLALRIEDPLVATTYGALVTYQFIDYRIQQMSTQDLSLFSLYLDNFTQIEPYLHGLLNKGWKIYPDHSDRKRGELGLLAPGSYNGFLRLCGIRFKSFSSALLPELEIQAQFDELVLRATDYIQRLSRQYRFEGHQSSYVIEKYPVLAYLVKINVQKEWESILKTFHLDDILDTKEYLPLIIALNYQNQGVLLIWATNPKNTEILFHELMGIKNSKSSLNKEKEKDGAHDGI